MTLPTPQWKRPDDAERLARLKAMKLRATGLLGVAGGVFVGSSLLEAQYPWLGYVRATAEASLVGGIADWFAVTALFRHPLGLPIPHTAIVATRKERIGQVMGTFVQQHFLSRDVVAANLRSVRPAERAARWLSEPANARRVARQVAGGLAKTLDAVPDSDLKTAVSQIVNDRVRATRVAPALGKALAVVLGTERRQELLNVAVRAAADAVRENAELIRQQVRAETPWWVPGVIDDKLYRKILAAIEKLLTDIASNPHHRLRAAFDRSVQAFVDRLQHSPEMIAKAEALKEDFLADPAVSEMSEKVWQSTRTAIMRYGTAAGEREEDGPLEQGIASFGTALLGNEQLLTEIDDMIIDLAAAAVDKYRLEIGDLIARTIAGWDPEATSQRFELAVGRDLQYVRINGTIVGGLVGLLIYTITRLL